MHEKLFSLLQKYDVPGPRYTSYPTVPAWTTGVQNDPYRKALRQLKPDEPLSLYFHIPFCENLCHFCGCLTVITRNHVTSADYVGSLLKEVDHVTSLLPRGGQENPVSQIHFGGGSPNFLSPEELQEIVEKVRMHFHVLPDAEIAVEMHPRTSTLVFCEKVAALGFNRISLGVQDLDPKVQKLINRFQTFEMTEEMVSLLRRLGLKSFNFDLIYGLPGQSEEGWNHTLQQVLSLTPNRLAVYSYAHVPWLKPVQRSFKESDLPSPEMKLKLFEMAYETLLKNGFHLIGMDHFATEQDDLTSALREGTIHRNFMGYSTKADTHQLGFGLSAISFVKGNYFQNEKNLPVYQDRIEREGLATFRGCLLDEEDQIRRDLIQQLMCRGRIDIRAFEKQWSLDFQSYFSEEWQKLEDFEEDKLLRRSPDNIEVIGEGFLFLRNMAMIFDRYLEGIREQAKNPVFSRTV